jgi:quinol monooxygenase YgiN
MKISWKWGAGILLSAFSLNLHAQDVNLKKLPFTQTSSFSVPDNSVTIIAWTQIKAGSEEVVAKATRVMTDKIRKNEPGSLLFEAHQGSIAPGTIIFYEVFRDQAAFEIHKNSLHVKEWFQAIEGLTTTPMNVNLVNNFDTYIKK